jgi:hypothetical protein
MGNITDRPRTADGAESGNFISILVVDKLLVQESG